MTALELIAILRAVRQQATGSLTLSQAIDDLLSANWQRTSQGVIASTTGGGHSVTFQFHQTHSPGDLLVAAALFAEIRDRILLEESPPDDDSLMRAMIERIREGHGRTIQHGYTIFS